MVTVRLGIFVDTISIHLIPPNKALEAAALPRVDSRGKLILTWGYGLGCFEAHSCCYEPLSIFRANPSFLVVSPARLATREGLSVNRS